jgi:hypothetical protein
MRMDTWFNPDIDTMRTLAEDAVTQLRTHEKQHAAAAAEIATDKVIDSLMQFYAILASIDTPQPEAEIDSHHMETLADHGLQLLDELRQRSIAAQCANAQNSFEQFAIPLAVWAARHHLHLNELEIVVNALSIQANRSHEPQSLTLLADVMGEIIEAINPVIKHDLDRSNPGRPWRVLNLNLGIVVTRCSDPQRMEAVFEQLLYRLPDDAPGFFDEGMRQMDIIGYPEHVRSIMQRYYDKTHRPTLH